MGLRALILTMLPQIRLLTFIVVLAFMAGCEREPESLKFSGATMGTTYHVTLAKPPADLEAEKLEAQVASVLDAVNEQMSTYREDSQLSRINQSKGKTWVPVSPELLALIKQASDINSRTRGAFDITVGPLVNLWGFGPEHKQDEVPAEAAIAESLRLVGFNNIILRNQPPVVSKKQDKVYIDLSAIAKGYGVDQVAATLAGYGLDRYLVEIGGELFGRGLNTEGKPWQVAVERPVRGARKIELVVNLQGRGMATSGDYRNFFEADGKQYSHTIDPRTGRPVTHDLHAVTVLAATTAQADALATALLVMGPKAGLAFARQEKIAALFISGSNGAYTEAKTQQFSAHVSKVQ